MSFRLLNTLYYIGGARLCKHLYYHIKKIKYYYPPNEKYDSLFRGAPKTTFLNNSVDISNQGIVDGKFSFLNEVHFMEFPPCWRRGDEKKSVISPLWTYNLHYFYYLSVLDYKTIRLLVSDWIDNYKPTPKAKGWTPYPTSLRLRNWIKLLWIPYYKNITSDHDFRIKLVSSMIQQIKSLWVQREFHFGGNHYLENLITFVFMELAFSNIRNLNTGDYNSEISLFSKKSQRILRDELKEQVLYDGGYFERSPMYHSTVLHHLLDLWNILPNKFYPELQTTLHSHIEKMIIYLKALTHPDKEIVLFNDASFDIAPKPSEILNYAKLLEFNTDEKQQIFTHSGYYTHKDIQGNYLVVDMAPVGPDYVPAHAHADFGSFELSMNGQRLITDTGTSTYSAGKTRNTQRSTSAHNTVELAETSQADCWKSFRVGRRYYPENVEYKYFKNSFYLSGQHNGYKCLAGKPKHNRSFWFDCNLLLISDKIINRNNYNAVTRIHFAPGTKISITNKNSFLICLNRQTYTGFVKGEGKIMLSSSLYAPGFGKEIARPCLIYEFASQETKNTICIAQKEFDTTNIPNHIKTYFNL